MGGKKKLTLKQMEKSATKTDEGKEGKKHEGKETAAPRKDKKAVGVTMPNPNDDKIVKELLKTKVLTPYVVASRLDLRISVAKDLLEELHRKGAITYVSGGRNLKIYTPAK